MNEHFTTTLEGENRQYTVTVTDIGEMEEMEDGSGNIPIEYDIHDGSDMTDAEVAEVEKLLDKFILDAVIEGVKEYNNKIENT